MTIHRYNVDGSLITLTPAEVVAWQAEQASFTSSAPIRLYTGAEIAAAIGRWGDAGNNATDMLTGAQWFALTAGNIPADHPAIVALLSAANKTAADL